MATGLLAQELRLRVSKIDQPIGLLIEFTAEENASYSLVQGELLSNINRPVATKKSLAAGPMQFTVTISPNDAARYYRIVKLISPPPNASPTITFTSPADGSSFTTPAAITLAVNAFDPDGTVTLVEFFEGVNEIGQSKSAPFTFTWSGVGTGSYILTAAATDDGGSVAVSSPISIAVTPTGTTGNQSPTVTLSVSQAVFPAPANIPLIAGATDADGSISAGVEFFAGAQKIGESTERAAVESQESLPPFIFYWSIAASGQYTLTAKATDDKGASATSTPVSVTVNALPIVSLTSPTTAEFDSPASIVFAAVASDTDGTVARVEFLANDTKVGEATSIPFTFTWANVSAGQYTLTARVTDDRGYSSTSAPLSVTVTPLTTLSETSPVNGESGVAVTRETIFRFTQPLAADTVLNKNILFAEVAGRQLLSRCELSSDRRTVTLFYLEPVPASARVRVTFQGASLKDSRGRGVDFDHDGQPGGDARVDFDTYGITSVPGTAVIGRVFASESATEPNGATADRPLANVTISVDGAEQTLRTVTDAEGRFRLEPVPAGRFFVHVDGRTAVGSQWPNGDYYPVVGKAWEALPGRTDNLANGTGVIYLPLITASTLTPVSVTQDTEIKFPPDVRAKHPELEGVSITVPANALYDDNGNRGGKVGIAPVPPDRLPEPLPPTLNPKLVITLQTDGPMNFDRPVPVRFPNLEGLQPGEKMLLMSFNHDTGLWEVVGSTTISADGRFAESDPGVGIRQPGWHLVQAGTGAQPNNVCQPGQPCARFVGRHGDVIVIDLSGTVPAGASGQGFAIQGPLQGGVLIEDTDPAKSLSASGVVYFVPFIGASSTAPGATSRATPTPGSPSVYSTTFQVTLTSNTSTETRTGELRIEVHPDYSTTLNPSADPNDKFNQDLTVQPGLGFLSVLRVQQRLRYLGFPGPTGAPVQLTGDWDRPTKWAVELFNAAVNDRKFGAIDSSGNPNPASLDAAANHPNAPRWIKNGSKSGTNWALDIIAAACYFGKRAERRKSRKSPRVREGRRGRSTGVERGHGFLIVPR